MIAEDYCSFELSKLLKKKGFDGECIGCYWDSEKTFDVNYELLSYSDGDLRDEVILAPTYQMAMKWLREAHKIFISIGIGDDIDGVFGYMAEIYCLEGLSCPYGEYRYIPNVDADTISDKTATTYEEAVEAALKYSLENLI